MSGLIFSLRSKHVHILLLIVMSLISFNPEYCQYAYHLSFYVSFSSCPFSLVILTSFKSLKQSLGESSTLNSHLIISLW